MAKNRLLLIDSRISNIKKIETDMGKSYRVFSRDNILHAESLLKNRDVDVILYNFDQPNGRSACLMISQMKHEGFWNNKIKTILATNTVKNGSLVMDDKKYSCTKQADAVIGIPYTAEQLKNALKLL